MKLAGLFSIAFVFFLGIDFLVAASVPEDRTWRDRRGNQLEGRLVGIGKNAIELRLAANGRVVKSRLDLLSDADRTYVEEWRKMGFGTKVERWPDELAPMLTFDAQAKEPDGNGNHIYHTPNFEFVCDVELTTDLIKEYSLAFEGTYYAIKELPLGLLSEPPEGRYVIRLFKEHRDYFAAGGPPGSAGVYSSKTREIMVPMATLGVRQSGIGGRMNVDRRSYDAGTLIHEITHQVMNEWLQILPVWFVEGMAEYMSAVPFDDARFEFSGIHDGIRDYLEKEYRIEKTSRGDYHIDLVPPDQLMNLSHSEWLGAVMSGGSAAANYRSAMMMVYFFIHLDGERDASPILAYLNLAKSERENIEKYKVEYNAAVAEFNSQIVQFNLLVNLYNTKLTAYRRYVAKYNEQVRLYQQQAAQGIPVSERVTVGEEPGEPPTPPEKPELPQILADRQEKGGNAIDLMDGEHKARQILIRKRSGEELWSDMARAFAEQDIHIRPVAMARGF